jgi:hypothetical protein
MPFDDFCGLIVDYDFDHNGQRFDRVLIALDGVGCHSPISEAGVCPHCHWVVPGDKYERVTAGEWDAI